jgi:hypothetical protein
VILMYGPSNLKQVVLTLVGRFAQIAGFNDQVVKFWNYYFNCYIPTRLRSFVESIEIVM